VVLPARALRFSGSKEVIIENVTRERLVSAPVIERTQITEFRSGRFEPALIERSFQHFGINSTEINRTSTNATINSRDRTRTEPMFLGMPRARREGTRCSERQDGRDARDNPAAATATEQTRTRSQAEANDPNMRNRAASGNTADQRESAGGFGKPFQCARRSKGSRRRRESRARRQQ